MTAQQRSRRVLWFVAIWLASVACVGALAFIIRLVLV